VPQVRQRVPGLKRTGEAHNSFHSVASKSRAGARKSIRNISFSAQVRFGEPGFPVTQHQTGPRVRLSVRKAAWSPSTPPNSIGNPGNLGHPVLFLLGLPTTQTRSGLNCRWRSHTDSKARHILSCYGPTNVVPQIQDMRFFAGCLGVPLWSAEDQA
jgi:hypothetical protein